MAAERESYEGLMHAGAGTGLFLVQLSALIPGLLPSLALAGLIAAVVLVPLLVVGLAAGLLFAPLYGLWRLARRERRHSCSQQPQAVSARRGESGDKAELAWSQKGPGFRGTL
jgi:hypothetical protein